MLEPGTICERSCVGGAPDLGMRSGTEARSAGVERSISQIRGSGGTAERGISSPDAVISFSDQSRSGD